MTNLVFKIAKKEDLVEIVYLLYNDELGKNRENFITPLPKSYIDAFENIDSDPNQELIVVKTLDGTIAATLQLSYIQTLTHQAARRVQIEGVRVSEIFRGRGLGTSIFEWAIERAKSRGARIIQLTSDKRRPSAIHFYEKLGFKASHEGMKIMLTQ